jgi:hypothetical protein
MWKERKIIANHFKIYVVKEENEMEGNKRKIKGRDGNLAPVDFEVLALDEQTHTLALLHQILDARARVCVGVCVCVCVCVRVCALLHTILEMECGHDGVKVVFARC